MKYIMLIYETPADFESRKHAESYVAAWRAYHRALVEAGVAHVGGAPLKEAGTATTIRVKDGRRHVQRRPLRRLQVESSRGEPTA